MCIHLFRQYKCWGSDETAGHRPSYIRRCANPDPRTCYDSRALPWMREYYDISCPECSGRFVAPSQDPVRVTRSMQTNREANDAAVVAYAKALCFFLHSILSYRHSTPPESLVEIYKAFKIEVACRFNKDHFDHGAYCPCQEANEWPEYRNISAAQRRLPARGLLYPREDQPHLRGQEMTVDWPEVPLAEECAEYFASFRAQPSPGELNPLLDGTPVLPFYYNRAGRTAPLFRALIDRVHEAFEYYTDDRGWSDQYLATHGSPEGEEAQQWALNVLEIRRTLLFCVAHFIANDNGLTESRAHEVFDLFFNLSRIGDDWVAGDIHEEVVADITRLSDPDEWDPQLTVFELAQASLVQPYSLVFLRDGIFLELEYHLWRSAEMRISDEHSREEAVEQSLGAYVTQEEYDALDETDRRCFICYMPMSVKGATTGPPANDDEAFALGHDATRITCRVGHVVGKKCFMEYWRTRRLVEGADRVLCDLCGRQPLHRTPARFLAYDLTLDEVMMGEYNRPLSWQSRAPRQWLNYG
ncbi:hypothetical protein SODALDRAFT_324507 [Sodiomyces alkalinus F11]|uniref:Uncharacterized protein n=1 Tax=Sodiomyces alkalinus (strain CBS 110278 / VKM F-3762 / F11) TaxID=1314773 RepID=A0A3N2PUQ2_SODAK|nr:hypothetical protein SODALDRAFT_324507 [Sodiomyces alkalinus F11]ROT38066.1 hypothetical protein SODALDRAFT_324507 [Sodiomyces alkalinus F11]